MRAAKPVRAIVLIYIEGRRAGILSNDRPTHTARRTSDFQKGVFAMDKALQDLLFEPWKNGACLGYAIKAMENLNYKPDDIRTVVSEMMYLLDFKTLEEADRHYRHSSY